MPVSWTRRKAASFSQCVAPTSSHVHHSPPQMCSSHESLSNAIGYTWEGGLRSPLTSQDLAPSKIHTSVSLSHQFISIQFDLSQQRGSSSRLASTHRKQPESQLGESTFVGSSTDSGVWLNPTSGPVEWGWGHSALMRPPVSPAEDAHHNHFLSHGSC